MSRRAYVSWSPNAGSTMALWLDHRPSCDEQQRDPDGWVSGRGVSGTDYEQRRLAELAGAPDAALVVLHGGPAEWWYRIERARNAARSKEIRRAARSAQATVPIPDEIARMGREAAVRRTW